MSALVKTTRDDGVVRITLDRPEARNAMSTALIAELTEAFRSVSADPAVRAVVLGGAGRDFCAGADLNDMKELGAASPEDNRADARKLGALFRAVFSFPRPVIGRVQGNVFGGANGLVAACDTVVVARGARFAFSEVRLGLVPAVISPYVVRRIGPGNARRLFLTGERFDAETAVRIGLASEVVAPEELDVAIDRVILDVLRGSPDAQRRTKELLDAVEVGSLAEAVTVTPDHIADARASEEGQEGLRAFLEKRPPRWAPTPSPEDAS